jgi:RNA polymerase sigma factor (sigma-70 family)
VGPDTADPASNPFGRPGRKEDVSRIGVPVERMDDGSLLAGFAEGTPEVSVAFVRRFQGHVYGVALAIVGDAALADDVAQHAFERAWRSAGRYDREKAGVRTWLTTITRNLAIDSLRSRKPTPVDPADLVRLLGPPEEEPEAHSVRADSARTLKAAIRTLPSEQARALVMAGMYRMTADEVARAENIPLGTAKTRIRAAMHKVRNELRVKEDER